MPFTGKYILAAIDGTGSHEWKNDEGTNSHTYQFFQQMDAKGGKKGYINGPGERFGGVVFGNGSQAIIEEITNFVHQSLTNLLGFTFRTRFASMSRKEKNIIRQKYGKLVRVVLIGHSRGGMIAINVASELFFPVYFMGLYDAVDMNPAQSCNQIDNADYTFHAVRHPVMGSRADWGNCGDEWGATVFRDVLHPTSTLVSSGQITTQFFMTSHGGINGDPRLHPTGAIDDISCSMDTLQAKTGLALMNYNRGAICQSEALAADEWMRHNAQKLGISFN